MKTLSGAAQPIGKTSNRSNRQASHSLESGQVSRGALAKRSFPRATPPSARKVFVARIDQLLSYWRSHGQEDPAFWDDIFPQRESLSALFQRMRSDERMQVTWGALAALSDDDFRNFMNEMQGARAAAGWYRGLAGHIEKRVDAVRKAKQAVRVLQHHYEETDEFDWDEEALQRTTLAGSAPGLPDQLKAAHAFLDEKEPKLIKIWQKTRQQLSRKSAKGRVEFIRAVAGITKENLGRPHYEIVAALANVVFNTDDDNSVTADGVRKIVKRKPEDSTG